MIITLLLRGYCIREAVGGIGVAVGGIDVAVGGIDVAVGGIGVGVSQFTAAVDLSNAGLAVNRFMILPKVTNLQRNKKQKMEAALTIIQNIQKRSKTVKEFLAK